MCVCVCVCGESYDHHMSETKRDRITKFYVQNRYGAQFWGKLENWKWDKKSLSVGLQAEVDFEVCLIFKNLETLKADI